MTNFHTVSNRIANTHNPAHYFCVPRLPRRDWNTHKKPELYVCAYAISEESQETRAVMDPAVADLLFQIDTDNDAELNRLIRVLRFWASSTGGGSWLWAHTSWWRLECTDHPRLNCLQLLTFARTKNDTQIIALLRIDEFNYERRYMIIAWPLCDISMVDCCDTSWPVLIKWGLTYVVVLYAMKFTSSGGVLATVPVQSNLYLRTQLVKSGCT
jgi:hypothetical protein